MISNSSNEDGKDKKYPQIILIILLFLSGFSIFSMVAFIPTTYKVLYLIIPIMVFFFLTVILNRLDNQNSKEFAFITFAFFIGALVNLLQWNWSGAGYSLEVIIFNKLISTILVVIPTLILFRASKRKFNYMYVQKGNLKLGLMIGSLTFLSFFLTAVPAAIYIFGGLNANYDIFISLMPWIMTFVFLNALREEIWFRAIFVRDFETFLGEDKANLIQALIFSFAHLSLPFTSFSFIYLILTFFLGLGFGAALQKTDSIIAPILFHAGADIPVILTIFSVL